LLWKKAFKYFLVHSRKTSCFSPRFPRKSPSVAILLRKKPLGNNLKPFFKKLWGDCSIFSLDIFLKMYILPTA